ncbi:F-box only protein 39-like [Lineus longissimus]|uniref:F-box only protein 39-like n=1 Tax=Lineus longissimus TaxID=88925 RepID=UPI00315CDE73
MMMMSADHITAMSPEETGTTKHSCIPVSEKEERNMWHLLPDVVLIEIFLHLDIQDRLCASQTCTRWARLMQTSGELWRELEIDLVQSQDDQKPLWQVRHHGHCTRSFTIIGYGGISRPIWERLRDTAMTCFDSLRNSADLTNFILLKTDLTEVNNGESVPPFLASLERLLRSHKHFKRFVMTGTKLQFENGMIILEALNEGVWKNLLDANLTDFFHWDARDVHRQDRFHNILGQFQSLRKLCLNYTCVSDEILALIGNNLSESIESLAIKVALLYSNTHTIRPSSWTKLHTRCKRLMVDFEFIHVYEPEDVTRCLLPEIRLRGLRVWSGYDMRHQHRIGRLIDYVTASFQNSLETASLEFDNTTCLFDASLLNLVSSCKNLQELFVCANMNVNTVATICEMRWRNDIGLTKFHVTLCCATAEEWEAIHQLEEDQMEKSRHHKVEIFFVTDLALDLV